MILKNPEHALFKERLITLLSRCDDPHELFKFIPEKVFINNWPAVRRRWGKSGRSLDYLHWWDMVYENRISTAMPKMDVSKHGICSEHLRFIGNQIREGRLRMQLTQSDLGKRVGMPQKKISVIERGKENITLATLIKLGKALGIDRISLR